MNNIFHSIQGFLKPTELRMLIPYKEIRAVVFALRTYEKYLLCKEFDLIIDSKVAIVIP